MVVGVCVHACMCGVLCLSGGKLVKRGRSDEDHSNSRETPQCDWLNTADCTLHTEFSTFGFLGDCITVLSECLSIFGITSILW